MSTTESARYACGEVRLPTGETGFRLEDRCAGVDALVVPARGCVLESFGVRAQGRPRLELLHPAEHFACGGGSPVLFPATGRSLCDGSLGSYRYRGQVYPMPIHGVAHSLPWSVSEWGADEESAWLTSILTDTPGTRRCYPHAFRLQLTYRVCSGALRQEARIENPGPEPLPFHLGYHPYFRVPLSPEGDRRRCLLRVPAASIWELQNLCATGRRVPIPSGEAFDPERALGDQAMDAVFADLRPEPGTAEARCWVRDPDAGVTLSVEFSPKVFPVFVVYTSPPGAYVCLEPWTGLPGGLGDDIPAGRTAQRVPPGGRCDSVVTFRVTLA